MPRTHLSKTDFLAALQCDKRAYLRVHHPDLAVTSESPAIETGRVVGAQARLEFPGGVLVSREHGSSQAIERTRELMADDSVAAIFEAGLEAEGVRVFVDILERSSSGWRMVEVKSASGVKARHIEDVSVQAWVAARAGVALTRMEVMHINSDFVYGGDGDYAGLFVREDITERVQQHLAATDREIASVRALLDGPEPVQRIGRQCGKPYECEFFAHCAASEPKYPLIYLPRINQMQIDQFHAQGVFDLRDIAPEALKSERQRWVRNVTARGTPDVQPGAERELRELRYPRYYLDFECAQFAIPIWANTRPFEHLPFQFSCHVEYDNGTLEHREFLDTSGANPSRAFAEQLIAHCGSDGPVVVYHAPFERGVISKLAEVYPDLAADLRAIHARIFDLLRVVEKHYYHPAMHGRWSIKNVLPCLAPELNYKQLGSVQSGTQAQDIFLKIVTGTGNDHERAQWREDLRRYCELDTLAMVRIAQALVHSAPA